MSSINAVGRKVRVTDTSDPSVRHAHGRGVECGRALLVGSVIACLVLAVVACYGPRGRAMQAGEPGLTDDTRAGTETYDALVTESVNALLEEQASRDKGSDTWLAFVGIEVRGIEELGEFRESLYENIDTSLVNSGLYRVVSRRMVDGALAAINAQGYPERVLLPAPRQEFLDVLHGQGAFPNYLLFAKVTTKTSRQGSDRETTYQMTLEMVDSVSGETVSKKTSNFRKQYTR